MNRLWCIVYAVVDVDRNELFRVCLYVNTDCVLDVIDDIIFDNNFFVRIIEYYPIDNKEEHIKKIYDQGFIRINDYTYWKLK